MIDDVLGLRGRLRAYERKKGSKLWAAVLETENIFLNQFYNDLFTEMLNGGSVLVQMLGVALGIGNTTPTRADVALTHEWNTGEIGVAAAVAAGTITSLPLLYPLTIALVSGNTITVAGQNLTVSAAGAAQGVTAIPVNSIAVTVIASGSPVTMTGLSTAPGRMSVTARSFTTTDPPTATWSFYLAAGGNAMSYRFQEAGLLYGAVTYVPLGTGKFASHAPFVYSKAPNTDLRLDYTVQRALT